MKCSLKRSLITRILLFAAFFIICSAVSSCYAEVVDKTKVTIETVDGKTKELDQVNDIVLETTGSRKVVKESFIKFMLDNHWNSKTNLPDPKFCFYVARGNVQNNSVSLSQVGAFYPDTKGSNLQYAHDAGIHPVAGKKPDKDGSLIIMYPEVSYYSGKYTLMVEFVKLDMNDKGEIFQTKTGKSYSLVSDGIVFVTDSASGIFAYDENGEGKEIFAITYLTCNSSKTLGHDKATYDAHVVLFDYESGNGNPQVVNLGQTLPSRFPVLRIAAGDFNHDGKANEFATIRSASNNGHKYNIQAFTVNNNHQASQYYSNWDGGCDTNNYEGGDIMAGDFNGDGKTDLAAIYSYFDGKALFPLIVTYNWNGKDFHREYKGSGFELGHQRKSYVPCFGLIAEAGDLNGDGHDEIVFLSATDRAGGGNLTIHVWAADNSLKPSQKLGWRTFDDIELASYGGESGGAMDLGNLIHSAFSLALVPVGDTVSTGGAVCKIFFSRSEGNNDNRSEYEITGDVVYYMTPQVDSKGNLTGLSDKTEWGRGGLGRAMKLVPGDFYYESMELGEPEHVKIAGYNTYEVTLKAPPYHIDFIQTPWDTQRGDNGVNSDPVNFSFVGRNVAYVRDNAISETKDISSRTQNSLEAGFEVKSNIGAKAEVLPIIGGGEAKAGITIGAAGGISKVNDRADKHSETRALTTMLSTKMSDSSIASHADYHIWRYPILKPAGYRLERNFKNNELMNAENTELDGKYYLTYTLCDTTGIDTADSSHNAQYDEYDPPYEEGNIFSYPNSVTYGMNNAQKILTEELTFSFAQAVQQTLTFTVSDSSTESSTTSWNASATADIHCDINANVGPKKLGGTLEVSGKLYGKYAHEAANTVTSTKTWSENESVTISTPDQSVINGRDCAYNIKSKIYVNEAGVLVTPFAVQLSGTARLWNKIDVSDSLQSPYVMKCDPALLLPGRFSYNDYQDGGITKIWGFSTNPEAATALRGMRIYDTVTRQYVNGSLEKGLKYEFTVPLYNASMVAVPGSGVLVEYGYQPKTGNGHWGSKVKLGEKRIPLGAWTNDQDMEKGGSNKGELKFEWTPEIDEGQYRFYIDLDPNNELDEVHESYSNGSEGYPAIDDVNNQAGNNNGYRAFGIVSTVNTASVSDSGFAFTADEGDSLATQNDFDMILWDVNNPDKKMTIKEFRKYVLAQTENVQIGGRVTYNGNVTLKEGAVTISCRDIDDSGTSRIISRRRIYAVKPGTSSEFYFTVNPEKLSEGTFQLDFASENVKDGGFSVNGESSSNPADDTDKKSDSDYVGDSGGGCNNGFVSLGISVLLLAAALRKK